MKKTFFIIAPFLLLFLCACPSYPTFEEFVLTKSTVRVSNLIGIMGENAGEPYVEVEYTIYENGKNVTKTEMLTPPFTIGANNVLVTYDSLNFVVNRNDMPRGIRKIKPDYNKNGSHYLKITNHSDKPIEYFIAGTQPMIYEQKASIDGLVINDGYDLNRFIESTPVPIFSDAPIFYLLHPEKRPLEDAFIRRITKFTQQEGITTASEIIAKRIKFTGNSCGDISLTEAWTVEKTMELYRDEYTQKTNGKAMFMNYNDADPTTNARISELENKFPHNTTPKTKLYGTIAPQQTLQNSGNIWVINTPYLNHGSISDEF